MRRISSYPFAIVDSGSQYEKMIFNISKFFDLLEPVPFGFSPVKVAGFRGEELRKIFPIRQMFEMNGDIRDACLQFAREKIVSFLKLLESHMRDDTFISHGENFGMTLRVRVIEDQPGYSLPPHRDSPDTIFAFILQLEDGNPTTSGFIQANGKINMRSKLPIAPNEIAGLTNRAISEAKGYLPELIWTVNQFSSNSIAWEESGNCWSVSYEGCEAQIVGFSEQPLKVPFGQLLAIHNPNGSFLFNSDIANAHNGRSFHGVFPRISRKRRLLLLDLLGNKTKRDFLEVEGMGTDPNSYYISFKRETTAKILRDSNLL